MLSSRAMWLQNQNASLINRQEALRDHFAGLAMQSLLNGNDMYAAATKAYNMADSMLAERDKKYDNI